jgi:hypothetical protein
MASLPFSNFAPGSSRSALDLPVAALAAVAAAFAAFAMPGDLMTGLVEASGLPNLLSAAAPPLGLKARIGVGLIGAAGAFGIVFFLLRLLDRSGLEPRRAAKPRRAPKPSREVLELDEPVEEEAPRLRRRDFHPDAPARRPISAVRDLGEPAPPQPPVASPWPEAPAPAGWPEQPAPAAWQDRPEPAAWQEQLEPETHHEAPEPIVPESPVIERQPAWLDDFQPQTPPESQAQPEARYAEPQPIAPDRPAPEPEVPPVAGDESLPDLMARLEQGLARRARPAHAAAPAPAPAPAPEPFPEPADDRLQNAIESLQRLAARD